MSSTSEEQVMTENLNLNAGICCSVSNTKDCILSHSHQEESYKYDELQGVWKFGH